MNTEDICEPGPSCSRRSSIETVYSIQGKETDVARDTSDTDAVLFSDSDVGLELKPATEPEVEPMFKDSTSGDSDNAAMKTKVIKVLPVEEDVDLWAADSEGTEKYESDSEIDLDDYSQCAQCLAENNNSLYRYCEKCFQLRKNFLPPRPKCKRRAAMKQSPQIYSRNPGIYSQINCQPSTSKHLLQDIHVADTSQIVKQCSPADRVDRSKRLAESVERKPKRARISASDTESVMSMQVSIKTVNYPSRTVDDTVKLPEKVVENSFKENLDSNELCIVCVSQPKSGVFVHGRIAHICCCYKCAMKVWARAKRCPVCNCRVSNVLKAVVM